jgi:hypothetical protein
MAGLREHVAMIVLPGTICAVRASNLLRIVTLPSSRHLKLGAQLAGNP